MISLFRGYNVCLCPSRRKQFFQGAKVPYHRRYTAFQFMTWTYIRWCSGFTNSPHGINFTSVGKQIPCDASRGPRFQEAEKFPAKVWWCPGASCTLWKSREARQLQGHDRLKSSEFLSEKEIRFSDVQSKIPTNLVASWQTDDKRRYISAQFCSTESETCKGRNFLLLSIQEFDRGAIQL